MTVRSARLRCQMHIGVIDYMGMGGREQKYLGPLDAAFLPKISALPQPHCLIPGSMKPVHIGAVLFLNVPSPGPLRACPQRSLATAQCRRPQRKPKPSSWIPTPFPKAGPESVTSAGLLLQSNG